MYFLCVIHFVFKLNNIFLINLVGRWVLQSNDNMCVGGCGYSETTDHLFFGCDIFGSIWYLVRQWLGISSVYSCAIRDHYAQFIHLAGMPRFSHSFLNVIWKKRNNHVFKNATSDPYALLGKVKLNSFLWLKTNQTSFAFCYHDWWHHSLFCISVFMYFF